MNGLSPAKQVLLSALEQIEEIERDMGGEVWALSVVYSVTKVREDGCTEENGGWSSTSEPAWVTAAMLRRAADLVEGSPRALDADEEDGES